MKKRKILVAGTRSKGKEEQGWKKREKKKGRDSGRERVKIIDVLYSTCRCIHF